MDARHGSSSTDSACRVAKKQPHLIGIAAPLASDLSEDACANACGVKGLTPPPVWIIPSGGVGRFCVGAV